MFHKSVPCLLPFAPLHVNCHSGAARKFDFVRDQCPTLWVSGLCNARDGAFYPTFYYIKPTLCLDPKLDSVSICLRICTSFPRFFSNVCGSLCDAAVSVKDNNDFYLLLVSFLLSLHFQTLKHFERISRFNPTLSTNVFAYVRFFSNEYIIKEMHIQHF